MREPKGPLVDAFDDAAHFRRKPTRRQWRRYLANKPLIELATPGLVGLLTLLEPAHPRRIRRLRRDLDWVHREAKRRGLLP